MLCIPCIKIQEIHWSSWNFLIKNQWKNTFGARLKLKSFLLLLRGILKANKAFNCHQRKIFEFSEKVSLFLVEWLREQVICGMTLLVLGLPTSKIQPSDTHFFGVRCVRTNVCLYFCTWCILLYLLTDIHFFGPNVCGVESNVCLKANLDQPDRDIQQQSVFLLKGQTHIYR